MIEPLDRGFGYTFGNSLRRVLLSSLEGAAVTSVKIEGVAHEFTTLPGVREDVIDIILNLKSLICRLHGESPEIEVRLEKKGPGSVTAGDIEAPADLEILSPELEIAHLSEKGRLEMTLTIGRGRGYVPAELNRGPEHHDRRDPGRLDLLAGTARVRTRSRRPASVSAPTTTSSRSTSPPTARSIRRRRLPRPPRSSSASSRSSPISRRSRVSAKRSSRRSRSRRRAGWRTSRSRSSSSASAATTASSASASRRSATS